MVFDKYTTHFVSKFKEFFINSLNYSIFMLTYSLICSIIIHR
jgi:hypothetical protein